MGFLTNTWLLLLISWWLWCSEAFVFIVLCYNVGHIVYQWSEDTYKATTSTTSVGGGITATTSVAFVTEISTRAGKARVAATSAGDSRVVAATARDAGDSIVVAASAGDSNSKDASQEKEQTLEDLRTYN